MCFCCCLQGDPTAWKGPKHEMLQSRSCDNQHNLLGDPTAWKGPKHFMLQSRPIILLLTNKVTPLRGRVHSVFHRNPVLTILDIIFKVSVFFVVVYAAEGTQSTPHKNDYPTYSKLLSCCIPIRLIYQIFHRSNTKILKV